MISRPAHAQDYLRHITLTTGHSRRSYRDEVADDTIEALAEIVLRCETTGQAGFPGPGDHITVRRIVDSEPSRHVAIWALSDTDNQIPLVTMALAMRARPGAGIWRSLHAHHGEPVPLATDAEKAPRVPWLGVIVHLTASLPSPHPALEWLADAERCIAWTWIERVYQQTRQ